MVVPSSSPTQKAFYNMTAALSLDLFFHFDKRHFPAITFVKSSVFIVQILFLLLSSVAAET